MEWKKAVIVDIANYRIDRSQAYKFEDEATDFIKRAIDALKAKRLQEQLGEKEHTDPNRGGRLANPQGYLVQEPRNAQARSAIESV